MGYIPLSHNGQAIREASVSESVYDAKTDVTLAAEAAQFLVARPALRLGAEFLKIIRGDGDAEYQKAVHLAKADHQPMPPYLAWWSLHDRYDSYSVMAWFKQRPDIRQAALSRMCDFPAKAGRIMDPSTQANLIEMVIEAGDRSAADFDASVRPDDIVAYGPADDVFRQFAASFPQERLGDPAQQERTLHVLTEVLMLVVEGKKTSSGAIITPILSHIDFRLALGVEAWHKFIPEQVRINVDKRRIMQERSRPDHRFTTRDEIREVGIQNIVRSFGFDEIRKVFDVVSVRVRFDSPPERPPSAGGIPPVRRELSGRLPLPRVDPPKPPPQPQAHLDDLPGPVISPSPSVPVEKPQEPSPAEEPASVTDLPAVVGPMPHTGDTPKSVPPPTSEVDQGWDPGEVIDDPVTLGPPPPPDHAPPAADTSPPVTQNTSVEIAAREAAYIPNDAFANAPDARIAASLPPDPKRGGSTSDLRTMQLLIEMQDAYGLAFPDGGLQLPPELVRDIYAVMTRREWVEDDQRMRDIMVNVLHALDPADYTLDGEWAKAPTKPLTTMFISNLRDTARPILMDVAKALEEKRKS